MIMFWKHKKWTSFRGCLIEKDRKVLSHVKQGLSVWNAEGGVCGEADSAISGPPLSGHGSSLDLHHHQTHRPQTHPNKRDRRYTRRSQQRRRIRDWRRTLEDGLNQCKLHHNTNLRLFSLFEPFGLFFLWYIGF